MPASTILLIEADAKAGESIRAGLARSGHQVADMADTAEALLRASEYDLVIIDRVPGKSGAADICRELRADPARASVAVLCIAQTDDVEERVAFLEAGADDVMARPFDERELEARVEALLLRFKHARDAGQAALTPVLLAPRQRLIAFFSPKGGVGTTTIAVNVAVAAAERLPGRVAIFDLDLQWGQVATHLDLRPPQSLAELARDEVAMAEPELLRSYAVQHESGLAVFCAPTTPDQVEAVQPEHVRRFLSSATRAYDVVVVDAGHTLDGRTLAVMEMADNIVFPLYPEIAALRALHSLLDALTEGAAVGGKTSYVLNHIFAREMLKQRDIENTLAAQITTELPYEPIVYLKAVNEGIPVVRGAPRSAPAASLSRLAATLIGDLPAEVIAGNGQQAQRKKGLGGLLKR
ncbi:MAG TPA: AAA family ATPase [Candidatus Limnocylindrales bacterium]|nr:AAA family ATPase [Candidatus Limnocylindrales bacterium]